MRFFVNKFKKRYRNSIKAQLLLMSWREYYNIYVGEKHEIKKKNKNCSQYYWIF